MNTEYKNNNWVELIRIEFVEYILAHFQDFETLNGHDENLLIYHEFANQHYEALWDICGRMYFDDLPLPYRLVEDAYYEILRNDNSKL